MKKSFLIVCLLLILSATHAQYRFYTKTGTISFNATSPKSPENIDAVNKNVTCVLDTKTGDIQFSVLMKGFEFERALMMEHFNENYVESNKYPKTTFKGIIENNSSINYTKDGSYPATVKGTLTMHGESKNIESTGKLTVKNGKITVAAEFPALLADFKIDIPQLVADKVAKTAKIIVNCELELFAK